MRMLVTIIVTLLVVVALTSLAKASFVPQGLVLSVIQKQVSHDEAIEENVQSKAHTEVNEPTRRDWRLI